MTLVDTNILIDIWSKDPKWFKWSSQAFAKCLAEGDVAVNPIICAELSLGFPSQKALDQALAAASLVRLDLPSDAAFLAGQAFNMYRKRGGKKASTLPDFFIGAHAAVAGLPILTRDATGYRTYFPTVTLVSPP